MAHDVNKTSMSHVPYMSPLERSWSSICDAEKSQTFVDSQLGLAEKPSCDFAFRKCLCICEWHCFILSPAN